MSLKTICEAEYANIPLQWFKTLPLIAHAQHLLFPPVVERHLFSVTQKELGCLFSPWLLYRYTYTFLYTYRTQFINEICWVILNMDVCKQTKTEQN